MKAAQWMGSKMIRIGEVPKSTTTAPKDAIGEALSAIKNGEGKIVVVMPIGAGKSMLFMLPAVVGRGGVTVVVVPFVTLRHDMKGRGERMGVSVGEWDSKRSMDGKLVVFVTPEAAIREGF
ncbi:hypothetical protein MBLNU13_g11331t1 [Cladosporium sp. NU13]